MAIISGTTVDWTLSPRIITIPDPIIEVTIPDLQDTLQDLEDEEEGIVWPHLRNMSGGESLGGGVTVGYTMELQDAQLSFEARVTPLESGTVTTGGTTTLIDSTATFQTNGVGRGDLVFNETDSSQCTVVSVDSQIQLTTTALIGGTSNDYVISDAYSVYDVERCNIAGGNLAAVDGVGAELDPIFPTFGTQVVRAASSSGTISGLEISNLQRLIESQRPHHTGTGDMWYWDPYGGSDTATGDHPDRAVKTFAQAHSLVADNNHDIIICVPGNPSGKTVTTENLSITKNYLFIRGPGRDFEINSANDSLDAVSITSNGVEISGMQVSTSATNTKYGIHTTGDFTLLRDLWVYGAVNGVHFENGEYGIADNVKMHHNLGIGLKLSGTCDHNDIVDCHIGSNTLDNAVIDLDASTHEVNFMGQTVIHSSVSGYGVNISATTKSVIIHASVEIFNNSLGDINDLSTNTYHGDNTRYLERSVWVDTELAVAGDGSQTSPFNTLTAAVDYAETNGIKTLNVYADIVIDRQLKNFKVIGVGIPVIDCNGQDLTKTEFRHCRLEGAYTGQIIAQECRLLTGFTLSGNFETCALAGDLTCADGSNVLLTKCVSGIPGLGRPTISLNPAGTSLLSLRHYSGGMTIKDCNTVTDKVTAEIAQGSLTFDSSNTDGEMVARGNCKFVNETNGATVYNETTPYLVWLQSAALSISKFIALLKALIK